MQPTKLIAVSGQGYRLLIIDQDSALLQLVEQATVQRVFYLQQEPGHLTICGQI